MSCSCSCSSSGPSPSARLIRDVKANTVGASSELKAPTRDITLPDGPPTPLKGNIVLRNQDLGLYYADGMQWLGLLSSTSGSITISGTPTAGDVLTATSATTATWDPIPPSVTSNFAEFYALMPGDNAATVAVDAPLLLPQDGPSFGSVITRSSPSAFQLATVGFYEVSWQVSVTEAAQMLLWVNSGAVVGAGAAPAKIPYTVIGRATGTSQLVGRSTIETTVPNTIISLRNGASASALTITPIAGGTDSVSANIVIRQLA